MADLPNSAGDETPKETPLQAEAYWIYASVARPTISAVMRELKARGREIGYARLRRWKAQHKWDERLARRSGEIAHLSQMAESDFCESIAVMNARFYDRVNNVMEWIYNGIYDRARKTDGVLILDILDVEKAIRALTQLMDLQRRIRGVVSGEGDGDLNLNGQDWVEIVMKYSNKGASIGLRRPRDGDGDNLISAE